MHCSPDDTQAHKHELGTKEFDSATLYRYATVNVERNEKFLENDTARTVKEFTEAFICSMPTGAQNATMQNRTCQDAIYVAKK